MFADFAIFEFIINRINHRSQVGQLVCSRLANVTHTHVHLRCKTVLFWYTNAKSICLYVYDCVYVYVCVSAHTRRGFLANAINHTLHIRTPATAPVIL